jgi:hypothetical protein
VFIVGVIVRFLGSTTFATANWSFPVDWLRSTGFEISKVFTDDTGMKSVTTVEVGGVDDGKSESATRLQFITRTNTPYSGLQVK